jgi:hypothetical protein
VDLLLHKEIFPCGRGYICRKYLLIITLRYINKYQTSNAVFIPKCCVGYTFFDKMVAWRKCNIAYVIITPYLGQSQTEILS